jgi:trans-aconitate methyltransferase
MRRHRRYNRKMPPDWNAGLYDASHAFVWEFGRDLVALLAPQPGERILDVGCGTGQLTYRRLRIAGRKLLRTESPGGA